jgi:hypothetical protein
MEFPFLIMVQNSQALCKRNFSPVLKQRIKAVAQPEKWLRVMAGRDACPTSTRGKDQKKKYRASLRCSAFPFPGRVLPPAIQTHAGRL